VKESRKFELAGLKKKKKEKHFGHLATFWFGAFVMLLVPLGVFFVMKHSKMCVIKTYKLAVLEICLAVLSGDV